MKISLFKGILMGVFGMAAVIGLFLFATYKGGGSKNAAGHVLIWGTLPKAGMQSALQALSQTDTDLKDVVYAEKDPNTLANDLATAIASGGASPDLILASQEELKSIAKIVTPIPFSSLSASTYQNSFAGGMSIFAVPDGTGYYGIPFLIDPLVLFSNRTILSSDGIARPPATWEAMIGLVPSVAILTPTRQITRGLIALGAYSNVQNARGILSTLFLQTGIPLSSVSPMGLITGNLGTNASSGAPSGGAVIGFYTQFADPSKVSYTWNSSLSNSEQMFLAGDLALYLGYASRTQYLRAANPNLDFAVSDVPQPATASVRSVYGLMYAFMIPRGASNLSGAYQIASLLSGLSKRSSVTEQMVISGYTGLAPAELSALQTAPADPVATVAYREGLYASGWLSPSAAATDQIFSDMINGVITGRLTIDAALASAEQSLTAALQQ
ncbi:extracellular solute-binding protein [Patescibacteria group bacterium]|nr:extracellular solute-binding protein [Patescibacteria group bacterium]